MRASRRIRPLPLWEQPAAQAAVRAAAITPGQVVPVSGMEIVTRPAPASKPAAEAQTDRRLALLEARAGVAAAVHESETASSALRACLRELSSALGWPVGRAFLLDPRGSVVDAPVWHGPAGGRFETFRQALESVQPFAGRGAASRALTAGKPVWIADVRKDGTHAASRAGYEAGLRSAVAFPVPAAGAFGAVVELYAARAEASDRAVLATCAFAARQLNVALERFAERDACLADRAAAARAEASTRDRERVLALVSHDLRNPLHVISIASGALLRAWSGDPERAPERAQMASIAQAAERMRRLVTDLMDVVQTDAGAFSVAPEPVPVGLLLRHAVEAHRPLAEEKGVALSASSFPASVVMADEQRVYQVFSNLVGNALRFTPAGGAVTLAAHVDGDAVRLTVADTGCGIAADDLPMVFERFWRGARSRGGAGLGLAITRTIVEAHGGRVWADSRPGEGSTFSFTLPLSDPACASA